MSRSRWAPRPVDAAAIGLLGAQLVVVWILASSSYYWGADFDRLARARSQPLTTVLFGSGRRLDLGNDAVAYGAVHGPRLDHTVVAVTTTAAYAVAGLLFLVVAARLMGRRPGLLVPWVVALFNPWTLLAATSWSVSVVVAVSVAVSSVVVVLVRSGHPVLAGLAYLAGVALAPAVVWSAAGLVLVALLLDPRHGYGRLRGLADRRVRRTVLVLVVTLGLAVALAVLRDNGPAGPSMRAADSFAGSLVGAGWWPVAAFVPFVALATARWVPWRGRTPGGVSAAILAAGAISALAFAPALPQPDARAWARTAVAGFDAHPGAQVVDRPAPASFAGSRDQASLLAALGFAAPFDGPSATPAVLDDAGRSVPGVLPDDAVVRRGPQAGCGWAVHDRDVRVGALPQAAPRGTTVRIRYLTGVPARVVLTAAGRGQTFDVAPPYGEAWFVVSGAAGPLTLRLTDPALGICVDTVAVGVPEPAR